MQKYTVISLRDTISPASLLYNRATRLLNHLASENTSPRLSAGIHSMSTSNFPKINFGVIKKDGKFTKFIMDVALAGYNPDYIDLEIDHKDRTISISYDNSFVEVNQSVNAEEKPEEYISIDHEIKQSSFERMFTAPDEADLTAITKSYSDGILRLEIPVIEIPSNKTKIKIRD